MKTIAMGKDYEKAYESRVLATKKTSVARVWPMPGTVVLEVALPDDELTPDQADELGRALIKAAEDARHLHHPDDDEAEALLDDRA